MNAYQSKMKTELGIFYLTANDEGLTAIHWKEQAVPVARTPILEQAQDELSEYFEGRRKQFSVPLSAQGTDFQERVWKALSRIPYGATRSYSDIAREVGTPKAMRAVGAANGRNPLAIIVPCHRVIASDGTLGGYAGGLPMKVRLLQIEGVNLF